MLSYDNCSTFFLCFYFGIIAKRGFAFEDGYALGGGTKIS